MDLTMPGGGLSSLVGTCGADEATDDVRDVVFINRMLARRERNGRKSVNGCEHTCGTSCSEI